MNRLQPWQHAILSLLVTAMLLFLIYLGAIKPLTTHYQSKSKSVAALSVQLAKYQQNAAKRSELQSQFKALQHTKKTTTLLSGTTQAVAAANLQTIFRQWASAAKANLVSSQPIPDTREDERSVSVRFRLEGELPGIQSILYQVDKSEGLLTIDELTINKKRGGTTNLTANSLDVVIKLNGRYELVEPI